MKKFVLQSKDMNGQIYFIGDFETKQEASAGLKQERGWLAASTMIEIEDLGENRFRAKNTKYGDSAEFYIKEL